MNWAPAEHDREAEAARLEIASDLGSGLTALGRRNEALKVLSRADAMAAQHFAGEPLRIHPLVKLGMFHLGFDDARALQVLRQAQAEHPADKLLDPHDAAHLGWQFGEALLANGQAAEAESALNASLAMFRAEFGRDNPSAVRAFGRAVSATARVDTTRASALIEAERHLLAERPVAQDRMAVAGTTVRGAVAGRRCACRRASGAARRCTGCPCASALNCCCS